jgi:hypothetical protein
MRVVCEKILVFHNQGTRDHRQADRQDIENQILNSMHRSGLDRMLSNSIIHGSRTLRDPFYTEKHSFGAKLDN